MLLGETFRAMRHPWFRRYWVGAFVSFVGSWIQTVAHGWLVYELTHSQFLLGVAGFVNSLPTLLLGPFGGTLADRFERRRILMLTQSLFALSALTLGLLTVTGQVRFVHILALALLNGCVQSVDAPTRLSMVSDLVTKEDLANGIALNAAAFHTARIFGPALGGLLLEWLGAGGCFLINSASYLAILLALASIPTLPQPVHLSGGAPLDSLLQGIRFVKSQLALRALVLNVMVVSLFGLAYMTLMPVFAVDVLKVGKAGLGQLYSAVGTGSLLGLLVLARLARTGKQGGLIVLAANSFGWVVIAFSQSESPWLSKGLLLLIGSMAVLQLAATNTLLQLQVPDHLRGRVVALHLWALNAPAPFGALLAGTLAAQLGAPMAVLIGGSVCTLSGVRLLFLRREIRRLGASPSPPSSPQWGEEEVR